MESPIRILNVIGIMDRGGAETMVMNLYRHMDRKKIQFDFMVHTNEAAAYDKEILSLGGRIFRVPRFKGVNIVDYSRAWNEFFKEHPEIHIVHGHIGSSAAIYLKIAKKFGCVTIAHSHSAGESYIYKVFSYRTRYTADYLFACSKAAGIVRYGEKQWKNKRGVSIKNGIDIGAFRFSNDKRRLLRQRYGVENDFIVGSVARFVKVKNHSFILDMFYEIKKFYKNSKLVLVGDGPLRSELMDKVNKMDLSEDVMFIGVVGNVNEYMSMLDVLLMPSLFEGLPVSIIEAQAAGLPCLISDGVPIECKITDLVRQIPLSESAEAWAKAAIEASRTERKDTSEEIKAAGYDVKENAEKLQSFYLKLAAGEKDVQLETL